MGSPGLQTAAAAEAAALAEESEAPKPKMQLGADRAWHVGCLEITITCGKTYGFLGK